MQTKEAIILVIAMALAGAGVWALANWDDLAFPLRSAGYGAFEAYALVLGAAVAAFALALGLLVYLGLARRRPL